MKIEARSEGKRKHRELPLPDDSSTLFARQRYLCKYPFFVYNHNYLIVRRRNTTLALKQPLLRKCTRVPHTRFSHDTETRKENDSMPWIMRVYHKAGLTSQLITQQTDLFTTWAIVVRIRRHPTLAKISFPVKKRGGGWEDIARIVLRVTIINSREKRTQYEKSLIQLYPFEPRRAFCRTRIPIGKIWQANLYIKKNSLWLKINIKKEKILYCIACYYKENKNKFKVSDLRTRHI